MDRAELSGNSGQLTNAAPQVTDPPSKRLGSGFACDSRPAVAAPLQRGAAADDCDMSGHAIRPEIAAIEGEQHDAVARQSAPHLTDAADAILPTWEDVADYFPGAKCGKCESCKVYKDGPEHFMRCTLLDTWKGLGREPKPSDCPAMEE